MRTIRRLALLAITLALLGCNTTSGGGSRCTKGCPCGASCINCQDVCHKETPPDMDEEQADAGTSEAK